MKKFDYSLQPILNIKEQKQKVEKEKLAMIISKYEIQKKKLNQIMQEINNTLLENENKTKIGTTALDIKQYSIYLDSLYNKINEQKIIISMIEKEINETKKRLKDISKEKEALENLKEKKYDEYKYLTMLEQNLIIDEQVSFKVAKSTIGG